MKNGYQGNPCLKTGGWIYLETDEKFIYGDIFGNDTGTIWVRVINDIEENTQWELPEGQTLWASMPKPDVIHHDGRMTTIIGKGTVFFEYDRANGGFKKIVDTVVVSDEWLKACGQMELSGIPLQVISVDSIASGPPMGTCYTVMRPCGREWVVFGCRLKE